MPLPGIAITRLRDEQHRQKLGEALEDRLPSFSHLLFTSKNGILAVLGHLEQRLGSQEAAISALAASGAEIYALGRDADLLRSLGINALRPDEASTSGLVSHLARRGALAGSRCLCPVPLVTGGLVEPPVVPKVGLETGAEAGMRPAR